MYDSPAMKSCLSIALVAALGLVAIPSFAEDADATKGAASTAEASAAAKPVKKDHKRDHGKGTQHGRARVRTGLVSPSAPLRSGVTPVKSTQKASQKETRSQPSKASQKTGDKKSDSKHPSVAELHPNEWTDHEHGEPASFADAPLWAEESHETLATALGRAVRGVRAVKAPAKAEGTIKANKDKREIEVGLEKAAPASPKTNAKSDLKIVDKADKSDKSEGAADAKGNEPKSAEPQDLKATKEAEDALIAERTEAEQRRLDALQKAAKPKLPKAGKGDIEKSEKAEKAEKPDTQCPRVSLELFRGPEVASFSMSRCDNDAKVTQKLSAVLRPSTGGALADPKSKFASMKADPRLVARIAQIADHFAKGSEAVRVDVISGIRPSSQGSQHALGRAVDLRIEGVPNEKLVDFCKSLVDTGCGYYPNSSFVHVDVRDSGTGHIYWIDASGPGETPRYVTDWPEEKSAR